MIRACGIIREWFHTFWHFACLYYRSRNIHAISSFYSRLRVNRVYSLAAVCTCLEKDSVCMSCAHAHGSPMRPDMGQHDGDGTH
jgi:hypothetical protein